MSFAINNRRFSCVKRVCVTIGFMSVFLSVNGQTSLKQALVRYQLAQQYLPGYDSLRQDFTVTSNEYDSLLRNAEQELERAYNEIAGRHGNAYKPERYQEIGDSLIVMQEELVDMEKTFNLIIKRKEVTHEEILVKSFQQLSLEFGKTRSLDLLLEAEPLFSKEPVVDLTDEFIHFLQEKCKKKR